MSPNDALLEGFSIVRELNFRPDHITTTNDLLTIRLLNDQMAQRLELPKEPELMYKLASIVFFDQHENPQTYEFKYGEKKIAFWKKSTSLTDFFLQKPLLMLIIAILLMFYS